mmetsp:Transcript_81777/g.265005  ORF Transcript_81777/g.265005 Transcript_81777/m.265005 type:complete len:245 (+) Transcript_81777:489-1223(+)
MPRRRRSSGRSSPGKKRSAEFSTQGRIASVTIATWATARATVSTARTALAWAARGSRKGDSAGSLASQALPGTQGRTTSWTNQVGKRVSSQSKMITASWMPKPPAGVPASLLRRLDETEQEPGDAGRPPGSAQHSSAVSPRSLKGPQAPSLRSARMRPSSARYSEARPETCSSACPPSSGSCSGSCARGLSAAAAASAAVMPVTGSPPRPVQTAALPQLLGRAGPATRVIGPEGRPQARWAGGE